MAISQSGQDQADPEWSPKLYEEYADWWPLVSAPEDYAEEVAYFCYILSEAADRPLHTMLELGCGGGNNASFFKADYQLTLTDRSAAMLAMSQSLNPTCEHLLGDMRTLRLGRTFDVVFVHDAIIYMTSLADLRQALTTAYVHCRPGGLALFVPDHVRETFAESSSLHGDDGPARALRYLEWNFDPDPTDNTYVMAFAYLFREADGRLWADSEQHLAGLFGRQVWLDVLSEVGFTAQAVVDPYERLLFLAKKARP